MATSAELVERGDLDELTRHVERLSDAGDWDELVDLRDRCRKALERGKQLWPVAANAEYHLALRAPGPWAAAVIDSPAARFALGPFPEVAASAHTWADLSQHVQPGPAAALAAHERVIRGEDLTGDPVAAGLPPVIEVPLAVRPWEPAYAVAEYKDDEAHFPAPEIDAELRWHEQGTDKAKVLTEDPEATRGLLDLVQSWTAESNGRAEVVMVVGGPADAVAGLGLHRFRIAEISAADAMAMMAWAGASGGAHGRRRGAAVGRFAAWMAVAGLLECEPSEVGGTDLEVTSLHWCAWDAGEPDTGWALRLAVEDPESGIAWALAATDSM